MFSLKSLLDNQLKMSRSLDTLSRRLPPTRLAGNPILVLIRVIFLSLGDEDQWLTLLWKELGIQSTVTPNVVVASFPSCCCPELAFQAFEKSPQCPQTRPWKDKMAFSPQCKCLVIKDIGPGHQIQIHFLFNRANYLSRLHLLFAKLLECMSSRIYHSCALETG